MAIVQALGATPPQVDAWRQAYLRANARTRIGGPAGVYRQLPADLPTFTGRAQELRRLIADADELSRPTRPNARLCSGTCCTTAVP